MLQSVITKKLQFIQNSKAPDITQHFTSSVVNFTFEILSHGTRMSCPSKIHNSGEYSFNCSLDFRHPCRNLNGICNHEVQGLLDRRVSCIDIRLAGSVDELAVLHTLHGAWSIRIRSNQETY
jgi:hypothetical protein